MLSCYMFAAVKVVIYKPLATLYPIYPTLTLPPYREGKKKKAFRVFRECRPESEERGKQYINSSTPPKWETGREREKGRGWKHRKHRQARTGRGRPLLAPCQPLIERKPAINITFLSWGRFYNGAQPWHRRKRMCNQCDIRSGNLYPVSCSMCD